VTILADEVLSTSGMLKFAQKTQAKEIIVGTEIGIIYRLKKENPGKKFIPASEQAVCPNMKLVTLEKILWSLEEMSPEVKVPEEIRLKAKLAVDKMLEIGRGD
jgi:quinolinate synthase